ncbi:ComEC/Rec2 family competence protein [Ornithinibacillus halophilus]|nr:MBL fold metallo-hydrolase [Ornithinibacillus halophilus]
MKVHFIDVGQGDSILIQTPNDKSILIDGGPPKSGKKVVRYLKKQNIHSLNLVIATHPDMDHIGGLPSVMKEIEVEKIMDSGKIHITKAYARYLSQIKKQHIPTKIASENEKIMIDPLIDITILNAYSKGKNNNESSLALKITYDEIDFLLMGDIEKEQEKKIMDKYELDAEILKVAHHGSKTSSSYEFFKEVKPEIAMITYSKNNHYGHPVDRVIDTIFKVNAQIYSTAVFGNVVVYTSGDDYFIMPEKSPLQGMYKKTS